MSLLLRNRAMIGVKKPFPDLTALRFWMEPVSSNMELSGSQILNWWDVKGNGANFQWAQGAGPTWNAAGRIIWENNKGLIASDSLGKVNGNTPNPLTIIVDAVETGNSVYATQIGYLSYVSGVDHVFNTTTERLNFINAPNTLNFVNYGNRYIAIVTHGTINQLQALASPVFYKSNFNPLTQTTSDTRTEYFLECLGYGNQLREPIGYMKNYIVFDREMDESEMDEWITNLPLLYTD